MRLRALAILLATGVSLAACDEADVRARAQMRADEIKAEQLAQRRAASLQRRVDYAWRMQIAKVCRQSGQYVLRGADGKLWLSDYTNPGKVASNGGSIHERSADYESGGNLPWQWDPDTYMSPVAAGNPQDVCQ